MTTDWQTWAAIAIVGVTAGVFLRRLFWKKKRGGCDSCGGGSKRPK